MRSRTRGGVNEGERGVKRWKRKRDRQKSEGIKEGEINHIVAEFPAVCR